ncbi:MAG: 30S ribosomal protein S6 [Nitrospinota bacterium]|jgi:small subunit ribosomal protein S6|nr:30S ribosomal protein S6 [Nitrospinota bacterium]HJM42310.1 30S ribosomal protein S6 [Nitrospinota bacterium]
MTHYETILIFHPDLSDEEIETQAEAVRDRLTAGGAELSNLEHWGKRRLAYGIRRQRYGHYVLYRYTGPAKVIRETENHLTISEHVLKYLTVRCGADEATPPDLLRGERTHAEGGEAAEKTSPGAPERTRPPAESSVSEQAPPAPEEADEKAAEPAAAEPEPAVAEAEAPAVEPEPAATEAETPDVEPGA